MSAARYPEERGNGGGFLRTPTKSSSSARAGCFDSPEALHDRGVLLERRDPGPYDVARFTQPSRALENRREQDRHLAGRLVVRREAGLFDAAERFASERLCFRKLPQLLFGGGE